MQNKFHLKILTSLLVVFVPFLWTNKTLDPGLYIQFFVLTCCLILFWCTRLFWKINYEIKNKTALTYLVANTAFILYSIVSVGISSNPSDAIFALSKYLLFFILLVTFAFNENPDEMFRIYSRSAVLLAFFLVIPAYYEFVSLISGQKMIIPLSTYKINSVFSHRNLLSEMLMLTLPFSAYSYFFEKKNWRLLGIIVFTLVLFMVVILSNRASWLAFIFASIVLLIIFWIKQNKPSFNKIKLYFISNTIAVILLSGFILFHFSDTSSLKAHSLNTFDFNRGSTKDRIELWERTAKLVAEKPIVGVGLGNWKIQMLKYGNLGLASEDNTTFYQRPHNDFLWIASEQGISGLVLYTFLFLLISISLIKIILNKNDKLINNKLVVILAVTIIYLIFSFFSFPKERIGHNIILFIGWGIFLSLLNSEKNNLKISKIVSTPIILLLILIGLFVVGFYRFKGEIHTKKAIIAKKDSRFQECINEVEKAKSVFYCFDETSTPLSWYSGLSLYKLGNYEKAEDQFKIAYRYNPYHIYVLNDYAGCLVKLNKKKYAIELYKQAIEIAPNYIEAKLNLCALYFNDGKVSQSFNILKSNDIENSSERYRKIVMTVLRKLIDAQLEIGQVSLEFRQNYKDEFNNFSFYKKLLHNSIKNDLKASEILYFYKKEPE